MPCGRIKTRPAHAEIAAIRAARFEAVGNERLIECDLYVTLEPCQYCAGAIAERAFGGFVQGVDMKGGAVDRRRYRADQKSCHHAPQVVGGLPRSRMRRNAARFFRPAAK